MRNRYLVSYDISDDKRLRRVFKTMRGYGDHLQYSVFRCDLSRQELATLRAILDGIIHHAEDQVLFADLGPVDGRGAHCMEAIGRAFTCPERHAVVV
jgi:CRISPR-associated protein Cas2